MKKEIAKYYKEYLEYLYNHIDNMDYRDYDMAQLSLAWFMEWLDLGYIIYNGKKLK